MWNPLPASQVFFKISRDSGHVDLAYKKYTALALSWLSRRKTKPLLIEEFKCEIELFLPTQQY